jgi:hypothetical protein
MTFLQPCAAGESNEDRGQDRENVPPRFLTPTAKPAAAFTKTAGLLSFRNLFLNTLSPAIVRKRPNSSVKRTPLLREEVGRTVSGSAETEEEIDAPCNDLVVFEGG